MRTAYLNGEVKQLQYHLCDDCSASRVNGVLVHEHGCPSAWKDEQRKCAWCGAPYTPERAGFQSVVRLRAQ